MLELPSPTGLLDDEPDFLQGSKAGPNAMPNMRTTIRILTRTITCRAE